NAGEARVPGHSRADHPDRISTQTPHSPVICPKCALHVCQHFFAPVVRIGLQASVNIRAHGDRCELLLHAGNVAALTAAVSCPRSAHRMVRPPHSHTFHFAGGDITMASPG